MKNLTEIANGSRKGTEIYYSFSEGAVYNEPGKGRFYVTTLLRPNTENEIKAAIRRWMVM